MCSSDNRPVCGVVAGVFQRSGDRAPPGGVEFREQGGEGRLLLDADGQRPRAFQKKSGGHRDAP